ncbi:phosphonate ABC transporter substrate-binding protein [Bartonella sp. HY406]|uniref:phosphonate ABC transporter substrate-binding protein n=1 Tax=Bartonella sp. HY406 TaxID=2979331 RepID=UPI0021CAACA1|nr:phosphonate ABC transporter substrate-binding protein [Bartonella sp. HY406]UXN02941.1 phosphonate ABC transporter substrate-binding protein [Bartonella sp. HY406]
MKKLLKSFALGIAMATVATVSFAQTLNFGIISTESQSHLKTAWDPFLADMKKKTGFEVKPFFASDYAGIIEGMRFGKVDIAWYGNKSAMEAVDRAKGEVIVQAMAVDGSPGYWGVLIVEKDSPIKTVEDVLKCDKTLNFGIGDPNSTSGYLVPMTFLFAANGIDPKNCFKTVRNANHETNALAVANKQVDVAANNTENMDRIKKNNPDAYAKLREIWRSPLIPGDPIVWRTDLPEETKTKIREFFLTYGTDQSTGNIEEEKAVLKGLTWGPFRASSNDQLLPIRLMEIGQKISKLENDDKLDTAEKKKQLDALNAEKADFEAKLAANTKK